MAFIIKKYQERRPEKRNVTYGSPSITQKNEEKQPIKVVEEPKVMEEKPIEVKEMVTVKEENKKEEPKTNDMDKISMAEQIINDTPKSVKRLKKDKGLIERTESSKTVLTEDNKQLLVD